MAHGNHESWHNLTWALFSNCDHIYVQGSLASQNKKKRRLEKQEVTKQKSKTGRSMIEDTI